jgi:glycosyltransferase involved in cell wall biosynthesis
MSAAPPQPPTPGVTVGVPASTSEDDLPSTLASLHASAVRSGLPFEIVVAVNGPDEPAAAVRGVEAFARERGLPLVAGDDQPARSPVVRLLRLAPRSKVAAWNAIRAVARAPIIVFADADVRIAGDAIPLLLARLAASPQLAIVAGREAAMVLPQDGLAARVAALPHRFDFGNVPGRLYALRAAALPDPLPATVLHEDAYLSVLLGPRRFAKEHEAVVYLRPPTNWRDYLRQRVRNEVGKLQLTREFPELQRAHGFGRYPWRRFAREIAPREYPLVVLSMLARVYARLRALRQIKQGFRGGWVVLPSTKHWPAADAARSGAPSGSTGT